MPEVDQLEMKAKVGEVLNRWPTAGLAVGVVRDGSLAWFHGHGVADIGSGTPVTQDTVFRIASITKTITAIAVMQLWEQGLVDLDAPANHYLRGYSLVPARASFRPATLRHLLTHTAGVRAVRRPSDLLRPTLGWGARVARPAPSLAEYYRGGLRVDVEPGTKWAYSNHGFATLGQIVEDVSGIPLDRYLRERVFGPLGMGSSDLVRSERVRPRSLGPGVLTDPQPRTMLGAGVEVVVRHGQLTIRGQMPIPAVRRGLRLHPDGADPYAFRIDLPGLGPGTSPVVFSRGPDGEVTALHLGLTQMSFQKRPATKNPRLWANGAVAVATTAIAVRRRRATRRQPGGRGHRAAAGPGARRRRYRGRRGG
jgi:CubicO group peptidase (beta-lactamase class C family)